MKRYYSPLRYPGGKDIIFDFVSSLIRENGLIGINYAEPFAGGAGLALHLLCSEYVGKIYLETKERPRFIVEQFLNEEKNEEE